MTSALVPVKPEEAAPLKTTPPRASREGSPWTGLWAVVAKEMADHLSSIRMVILEALIIVAAFATVYVATSDITQSVSQDRFLYLRLFTTTHDPLPAFAVLLVYLIPLVAISLGFDTVNGEFNRRTITRVLAQPIYRDALLLGKFLGGLFTLALVCTSVWLLILGFGIFRMGAVPGSEDISRSLWFLLATIIYGAVWLAVAMLFSVIFRQPATAALASIAIWLFLLIFWDIIAGLMAQSISPIRIGYLEEYISQQEAYQSVSRLSPNTLYTEIMVAILQPETRSLGILLTSEMQGAIQGTALPIEQSLLLVWGQVTGMVAGVLLLFVAAYIVFQRQEIRP
jgi:ABC-2 type transport system permease protein